LQATGIPPHLVVANQVNQLQSQLRRMQEDIAEKMVQLPEQLKNAMLHNFAINGAIPLTESRLAEMINASTQNIIASVQLTIPPPNVAVDQGGSNALNNNHQQYNTWNWANGSIHPVPETFRFPSCNVRTLWDLYWSGDSMARIAPYRILKGCDLFKASDKQFLSKAKGVMKLLIEASNTSTNEIRAMTLRNRDILFETTFLNVLHRIFPDDTDEDFDARRIGEMKYLTLYDLRPRN